MPEEPLTGRQDAGTDDGASGEPSRRKSRRAAAGSDGDANSGPDAVPPAARLSISLADPPLYLDAYPEDAALATGQMYLLTHGTDVFVGVESTHCGREADAGFYVRPEGAEAVAALLREFAAAAREGEERVFP